MQMPPNLSQLHDIAGSVGTPVYVYDAQRITANYKRLQTAFPGSALCYAVKANSNLSILKLLRGLGAQFDVVSWGEAARCIAAGVAPAQLVFAGVGKSDDEISRAIRAGVGWINVESAQELQVISDLAQAQGCIVNVALRINPAVDPHTHQYLATGKGSSKFGINLEPALALAAQHAHYPGARIAGVHAHIGSQLFDVDTYAQTMRVLLEFVARCGALGLPMTHVDMGGGFGVDYRDPSKTMPLQQIAAAILPLAQAAGVSVQFEPGRYIVADAGLLLARVLYIKENGGVNYAVVDAAMNDLIRPTLYQAFHNVTVLRSSSPVPTNKYDIVGPICESGDWLAKGIELPQLKRGDWVAFSHAGAYSMSMASNYNTRSRGCEVLVDGDRWRVVRRREPLHSLWELEL